MKSMGRIRPWGGPRTSLADDSLQVSYREIMAKRVRSRLGRFLRKCRLENRLSLREVERLSEGYREKVANSYLSTCEQGKMVPSLPKLLVLAAIFGKPFQLFMDQLELDILQDPIPEHLGPDQLREMGIQHAQAGNLGRALACFGRRGELLESTESKPAEDLAAEVRMDLAIVFKRLGKLPPARQELDECLRMEGISTKTQTRCLDLLAGVEREMGCYLLARLHSAEARRLAEESKDLAMVAHSENTLGNILFDGGNPNRAFPHYESALSLFDKTGDRRSYAVTASNFGTCLVSIQRFDQGIRWIRKALKIAQENRYGRLVADNLACLARAHFHKGDIKNCNHFAYESINFARKGDYFDILFTAYYYLWREAQMQNLPVEEKRLLKSLRYFRSKIESMFPETRAFDNYLLRNRKGDS